eukprot:778947-Amorphochlora_amoeboformis.AAC.2
MPGDPLQIPGNPHPGHLLWRPGHDEGHCVLYSGGYRDHYDPVHSFLHWDVLLPENGDCGLSTAQCETFCSAVLPNSYYSVGSFSRHYLVLHALAKAC